MIEIKKGTRNTKSLRLKIYKEALKIIIEDKGVGFCAAIGCTITFNDDLYSGCDDENDSVDFLLALERFDTFDRFEDNYPELYEHRPKKSNEYWFPLNDYGQKKRIKILEKVIADMEKSKLVKK
jgi:hypothetical protein